jgi:phospholipid transport system substrate-binding protein
MTALNRRHVLLTTVFAAAFLPAHSALAAANPAESFIADNIHLGFEILNDKQASAEQRKQRFATFLLGVSDVRRVALFLLGQYAAGTSPADQDAFVAAYQDFTLTVYQSYFAQYAGQSLQMIGSRMRAPGDFVVRTNMVGGGGNPMEVDFRVRTDGAKPVLVDLCVGGVWLALAQRDEFGSVLGQNKGDVKALIAHLQTAEKRYL